MVPAGFEPATHALSRRRSTKLSYEGMEAPARIERAICEVEARCLSAWLQGRGMRPET